MKIEMVSIFVNDVHQAFTFYTEVLAFQQKMYVPEAFLAIVVSPEHSEGTSLLLEPNNNPIAADYQQALFKAGIPAMTFSTTDIYQEHQRLSDAGVIFRKAPQKTDWGVEAIFEDTCGNLVQLVALN